MIRTVYTKRLTPRALLAPAAVPNSDLLLVADGYGSSYIHFLNKTTGAFLEGRSFGGKGNATSPRVQFDTPHSVSLEPSGKFHN